MMLRYIFVQWASRMYGVCTLKAAICILKGAFMCTCFIRIRQITAIIVYSVRAGKHNYRHFKLSIGNTIESRCVGKLLKTRVKRYVLASNLRSKKNIFSHFCPYVLQWSLVYLEVWW